MARRNYTDEFRQRAVDLYESTPSATLKGIAADLGISRGALKEWVDKLGSGVMIAPPRVGSSVRPESQTARILRLEAELAAAPTRVARAAADAALAERIRVLQDPAPGAVRAYGAPRITTDLNESVAPIARVKHKRVARVMREHQPAGIPLRRPVKTTIPAQSGRRFPDLIERDFRIGEPGRRYVGDITYLPIADGANLCLATVIDLGSRKLAGWQVADHMRTELVEDALKTAWRDRGSLAGAVYASKAYAALCEQLKVTQSMGAVGTNADNSLAENFNATLKRELLEGRPAFPDRTTVYRAVFRWANRYNTRRHHSAIGQVGPN